MPAVFIFDITQGQNPSKRFYFIMLLKYYLKCITLHHIFTCVHIKLGMTFLMLRVLYNYRSLTYIQSKNRKPKLKMNAKIKMNAINLISSDDVLVKLNQSLCCAYGTGCWSSDSFQFGMSRLTCVWDDLTLLLSI